VRAQSKPTIFQTNRATRRKPVGSVEMIARKPPLPWTVCLFNDFLPSLHHNSNLITTAVQIKVNQQPSQILIAQISSEAEICALDILCGSVISIAHPVFVFFFNGISLWMRLPGNRNPIRFTPSDRYFGIEALASFFWSTQQRRLKTNEATMAQSGGR
jgi:hypothetical protein